MKWARVFQLDNLISARLFGLDAVQGSKEKRASRTQTYGERVTDAADVAMRQEGWGSFGLAENRPDRPKSSGGYTIVEVMVFLMISAVIFFGAVTVFQGQQDKTAFEQGMRDLASQLQKYVDEVSTSSFLGGDKYSCLGVSSPTGRAQLNVGGSGLGSNQECIFLGRAIQVVPTQQTIFIYSVLGNKNAPNGDPITSFANTMPEPAFSAGADLTDTYFTSWAKVSSSKVTYTSGTTADSDLVGFYNSLQDGFQNSGVTGAQAIFAKGYNYQSSDLASAKTDPVKSCIEEQNASGCANTQVIKSWNVCFASTRSDQTAILAVASTPAGITTDVNFTSCP